MKQNRLMPWYGADTTVAESIGKAIGKCDWACVLFAGGCSILPYIDCRAGVASDLHRHVINLARVVRDPVLKSQLVERLNGTLFHPEELNGAQHRCLCREDDSRLFGETPACSLSATDWAYDYFITGWMGRGGVAGTDGEFRGAIPTRWNANGGGSNTRFRSMIASLDAWQKECTRWEWECLDCFEMLERIKENPKQAGQKEEKYGEYGSRPRRNFKSNYCRDS